MIEPVLFGGKFDMHEVTVLASLTLWYVLWGVPGAVRPENVRLATMFALMQTCLPQVCTLGDPV